MKEEPNLDYETCLQAMKQFPSHALIQEQGCTTLWKQSNNAEACLGIGNVGGIPLILDAMRGHPQQSNLQHAACETLRNLCIAPNNRSMLLQSNGVPVLVEMMRQHVDNSAVQKSGCTTLASVAEGGMEYKIAVAECGGILAVMKAVEMNPDNDDVLRAAYQALRMLGYNPGANNGGM